jgi:hypothetical protein
MAKNHKDINEILQSCLEAVQSGEETVGSVLARYPDLEQDLRPQLEAAYWLFKNKAAFNPRPEFIAASRRRLMREIKQGGLAPEPVRRASFWQLLLRPGRAQLVLRVALALILLVVFVFGSSRVVLAAQYTIPGDNLYPVKIAGERAQVLLTFSDAGDARLYTRFAQKRLLEIQELILENRFEYVKDTVEAYDRNVDNAVQALRRVATKNSQAALQIAGQLEQVLKGQNAVLEILAKSVPSEIRAELVRAMQVSEDGVQAVQEISATAIAAITTTPTPTQTFTFTPTSTGGLRTALETGTLTATQTATGTITLTPLASGTPVGSGTPAPTEGAATLLTQTPTATQVSDGSPTATRTSQPSKTPTKTNVPQPTFTFTPTATERPGPSSTPSPSQTSVTPPTNTPTSQTPPTLTPTPTTQAPPPTNTPIPPPTNTPVPPPTNTPVPPPPTDTPVPACALSANVNALTGNKVDVQLQNRGDTLVTVTRVVIDWPVNNEELKEVEMGGSTIWSGTENSPPTTLTQWSGSDAARQVNASSTEVLRFTFKRSADPTGYAISVTFDNGCSVTARR